MDRAEHQRFINRRTFGRQLKGTNALHHLKPGKALVDIEIA